MSVATSKLGHACSFDVLVRIIEGLATYSVRHRLRIDTVMRHDLHDSQLGLSAGILRMHTKMTYIARS